MPTCYTCGERSTSDQALCPICGTPLPKAEEAVPEKLAVKPSVSPGGIVPPPPGSRFCPACGKIYGADFGDSYCVCGVELATAAPKQAEPVPVATPLPDIPEPGTPCLVLYRPDRLPWHYYPLVKDVQLIGRLDPVAGVFPDIDLAAKLDADTLRKISRKHALLLHQRSLGKFFLRPLAGNTGTQIEADMVAPLQDYPLSPGTRIILGGAVRLKLEIT